MQRVPLKLPQKHHELSNQVLDCEIAYSPGHPASVVLIASIADGSTPQVSDQPCGRTATTLAFRMDHPVARKLLVRLAELGRSMDWLPATGAQEPSSKRSSEDSASNNKVSQKP
jgi:hypothetical protein